MDDVEDGVKYAIEKGWADKDKVAIYGGSHGGYATLMGLIKTPGSLYLWCGLRRSVQHFYLLCFFPGILETV